MILEPITLEGQHVRLEPLTTAHLAGLIAAGRDRAIFRWMPVPIRTDDDIAAMLETALADQAAGTAVPFATIERATGRVVGSSRFMAIDTAHRRVEIGWTWIAPAWQRTAVNSEAKRLMLQHAFETWGCNRVEFKTDSLNVRSRAALTRLGAVEEGTFRNHMVVEGGARLRHSVYFSITPDEWPAINAKLAERLQPGRQPDISARKKSLLHHIGGRILLYGALAGLIFYIQPAARCVLNPLREANLLAPCLAAGNILILPASSRAYALVQAAYVYKATGQNEAAITTSERAFALDPAMEGGSFQIMEFLLATGQANVERRDYAAAERYFTRALAYQPAHVMARIRRAEIYRALENQQAAADDYTAVIVDLDKAIAKDAGNGLAYRFRGLVKGRLGDVRGALLDIEEAILRGTPQAAADKVMLLKQLAP